MSAHDAHCDLAHALQAAADLPIDPTWTLRAAVVPAGDILGDCVAPKERWIPVLMQPSTGRIHHHEPIETEDDAGHGIAHIVIDWMRAAERRPGRIDADSAALATSLRLALEPMGAFVRHVPPADGNNAGEMLNADLDNETTATFRLNPGQLAVHKLGLRAAVDLHAAQPWRVVSHLDPILIDNDLGQPRLKAAVVAGTNEEVTILLLPSADAAWAIATHGGKITEHPGVWIVDFPPLDEVRILHRHVFRHQDFPRTADGRWPRVRWIGRDLDDVESDEGRPITVVEDVGMPAAAAAILAALAKLDDATVNSGRWETEVVGIDGPVLVAMSWPDAASPPSEATWRARGVGLDGSTRMARLVLLDRLKRRDPAMTAEQAEAALQRATDALLQTMESTARTPVEQAEATWARALHAHGRAQRLLAERALAQSRDCAGAWLLLGDLAVDANERIDLLREAADAGERCVVREGLGGNSFPPQAAIGLEALLRLAVQLRHRGRGAEAFETLRLALRRHPGDAHTMGRLGCALLGQGEVAEALALVHDLPDGPDSRESLGLWVRAVAGFLVNGDTPWVRRAIAAAVHVNGVAGRVLLQPSLLAEGANDAPALVRLKAEAVWVLEDLRPLVAHRRAFFEMVQGAMDALVAEIRASRSGRRFKERKPSRR